MLRKQQYKGLKQIRASPWIYYIIFRCNFPLLICLYHGRLQKQFESQSMNAEAEQKRAKFRCQIRRRHLNDIFTQARQKHKQMQIANQNGQTQLTPNLKQQILQIVQQFIKNILKDYQRNDLKSLNQNFHSFQNLVKQHRYAFSICLDQILQKYSSLIVDTASRDIKKQLLTQVASEKMSIIDEELCEQQVLKCLQNLMSISKLIQYKRFSCQSSIVVSKLFWNLLSSRFTKPKLNQHERKGMNGEMIILQNKKNELLSSLLESLVNLFEGPNLYVMKKHFNKMGLSSKLNEIIDISIDFNTQTHQYLLQLIYLYNKIDPNDSQDFANISGITVLSSQSTFKQKFVLYCIYFIRKNKEILYELAMTTLSQLFDQNPYFIDSIKSDYYDEVLQLLLHQNRKINVHALNLLSTIVFYSQSASDELLEEHAILDYLYGRLALQQNQPSTDINSKKSIEKCTNIICDLLLTKNQKLKRIMYRHHIWQFLFQSISEESKFFPTISVFRYFFSSFNRKERFNVFPSFLESVSRLSLQNELIPQIKQIKLILCQIFDHSLQYSPDEDHKQLVKLYEENNLLKYIIQRDEKIEKLE